MKTILSLSLLSCFVLLSSSASADELSCRINTMKISGHRDMNGRYVLSSEDVATTTTSQNISDEYNVHYLNFSEDEAATKMLYMAGIDASRSKAYGDKDHIIIETYRRDGYEVEGKDVSLSTMGLNGKAHLKVNTGYYFEISCQLE